VDKSGWGYVRSVHDGSCTAIGAAIGDKLALLQYCCL
jgi:hypothetical protein